MQAAAAVPLMFPPVPLFGHLFCEAGIRDYTPVFLAAAPKVRVKLVKMPTEYEGFTMDFGNLPAREGLRKPGVTQAQRVL